MSPARVANLASIFQEILTVIVRVRSHLQVVEDAEVLRAQIRQSLEPIMRQARGLGYTDNTVQAAVFAVVALLDESVLNLQDSTFANWARRPLQEELFGGHLAGETFFRNLRSYLSESDSPRLADVLELHCLCLLLGYRGRYALGDSGEMYVMLRQARERIARIRGGSRLLSGGANPMSAALAAEGYDFWSKRLLWTSCVLASLLIITFVAYSISLASTPTSFQSRTYVHSNQNTDSSTRSLITPVRASSDS